MKTPFSFVGKRSFAVTKINVMHGRSIFRLCRDTVALAMALLLVACGGGSGGEGANSSAPNADNGVEFPLSKELAKAVAVSQGNLRVAAVLEGSATASELDVSGLVVDAQKNTVTGQLSLPPGSYSLAVYYYLGVSCGAATEVKVAKLGPTPITVTANAQTQVAFDAIDSTSFDDDKDGVSNLAEINQNSLWCDASSSTPPVVLLSPQNLHVDTTAVASGVVTLLWDPVPDATQYKVYLGTDSQLTVDNYQTAPGAALLPAVGAAPISGSPYTIPADKVKAGLTYYFIVAAYNSVQKVDGPASDRLGVFVGPPPPAPNKPPVAVNDVVSTTEDAPVDVSVSQLLANDTDPDGDALILALVSGVVPTQGKLESTQFGVYRYTPALNYNGTAKFQYTVQDGHGGQATGTVNITVTAVNDAPVPQDDAFTTNEDTALETLDILSNDRDVDGNVLTVKSISTPANGTLSEVSRGVYRYVPKANFTGQEKLQYTVTDGLVDVVANLKISVIAVNDAPVAQNDVVSTNEDTASNTINVLANDTDADGDKLTVTAIDAAQHGVLSLVSAGNYRYVPAANFSGTEAINYTISDGKGGESTATITITVNPVNDAPVAVADAFSTPQDTMLQNANVLTNDSDIDGNPLTVTFPASVSNGTLTVVSNGVFNFMPAARFSGQAKFSYTLDDGAGGKATGNVTVNVNHVNHPPVANDDSFSTNEDPTPGSFSFNVLANDTDPDKNDQLAVVAMTSPQHGVLKALKGPGVYSYDPDPNFNGTETLKYTIDDGGGAQASANVTITVLPVVDRVVAVKDTAQTTRDKSVTISVLANDTDPDGNATVVSFTPPKFGVVVKNADNTLTYTPNADATSAASVDDTFTYTMGNSLFNSTASVTVTVLPTWSGAQQVNVTTNIAHAGDLIDPNNPNGGRITDPLKVLVDKNSGVVTAIWEEKIGAELSLFAGRQVNGAWGAPVEIDHGVGSVTGYDAVIDGTGVVTVLFIQSDGSIENVWSRRYTDTWQPEQAVESAADPVWGANGHGLVVDGQNVVTAFWVQDGSVTPDPVVGTISRSRMIMASRFSNNAWTTPAQVESFPVGFSLFAKAVVDKTGVVTALFGFNNTLTVDLYANRFENGAWGAAPTNLTLNGATIPGVEATGLLDVLVNNAGDVTALTVEYQGGGNVFVLGAFRPVGQSWQTTQILGPQTGVSSSFGCCVGRLVADGNGVITALWDTVSAQGIGAKLAARHDGTGWTQAVPVSAGGTSPDALALSVDASNRIYAAFSQDAHVHVARYNSGQWDAPQRLDSAGGRADYPALVTAANGDVTAIWEQNESNPAGSSMWTARLQNGVWQPAQLLESRGSSYASYKQLVIDQAGLTTAVWQHSTPQGWVLLSNTYR